MVSFRRNPLTRSSLMHPALTSLLCLTLTATALTAADKTITSLPAPYPTLGSIERLDPALDALLPAGAVIEKLAEGFSWSEGPVWVKAGEALLFSDVPQNRVYRWTEGKGITVFLEPSGFTGEGYEGRERGSNGLTFDRQGRLTLCQHGDRRLARLAPDGKNFATLVDRWEGKRLNSPNDLCFDRAGNLFFTDPPYGLGPNTPKEIEFNGVYRLSVDGKLTVLSRELERPNGIALSADERTLYVANSHGPRPIIMAYPLHAGGTVGKGRVFWDSTELVKRTKRTGALDGLKVDTRGNLWATGPGGVLILNAEGKHLGTILTGHATANCAFGGPDGRTLYMTANNTLLRIQTNATDANW